MEIKGPVSALKSEIQFIKDVPHLIVGNHALGLRESKVFDEIWHLPRHVKFLTQKTKNGDANYFQVLIDRRAEHKSLYYSKAFPIEDGKARQRLFDALKNLELHLADFEPVAMGKTRIVKGSVEFSESLLAQMSIELTANSSALLIKNRISLMGTGFSITEEEYVGHPLLTSYKTIEQAINRSLSRVSKYRELIRKQDGIFGHKVNFRDLDGDTMIEVCKALSKAISTDYEHFDYTEIYQKLYDLNPELRKGLMHLSDTGVMNHSDLSKVDLIVSSTNRHGHNCTEVIKTHSVKKNQAAFAVNIDPLLYGNIKSYLRGKDKELELSKPGVLLLTSLSDIGYETKVKFRNIPDEFIYNICQVEINFPIPSFIKTSHAVESAYVNATFNDVNIEVKLEDFNGNTEHAKSIAARRAYYDLNNMDNNVSQFRLRNTESMFGYNWLKFDTMGFVYARKNNKYAKLAQYEGDNSKFKEQLMLIISESQEIEFNEPELEYFNRQFFKDVKLFDESITLDPQNVNWINKTPRRTPSSSKARVIREQVLQSVNQKKVKLYTISSNRANDQSEQAQPTVKAKRQAKPAGKSLCGSGKSRELIASKTDITLDNAEAERQFPISFMYFNGQSESNLSFNTRKSMEKARVDILEKTKKTLNFQKDKDAINWLMKTSLKMTA